MDQFANFSLRSFREFLAQRLHSLLALSQSLPVVVAEYDEVITAEDALAYVTKFSDIADATLATNTMAIALHGWEHIT